MKRQAIKTALINFELQYPHMIVKSPKYIYGGAHCGLSDGRADGATDGLGDGSVAGYDDGYDAATM